MAYMCRYLTLRGVLLGLPKRGIRMSRVYVGLLLFMETTTYILRLDICICIYICILPIIVQALTS